jgi:hypothetical protein
MPYESMKKPVRISQTPAATTQATPDLPGAVAPSFNYSVASIPVHSPIQRVVRQTTLFDKRQQRWHKQMQIIDSTDSSAYVHLSRSTVSDAEDTALAPADTEVVDGDVNKRARVEAPGDLAGFKGANNVRDNNVHITLEGRYKQVMRRLQALADEREAIKSGPPVVGDFANLNFRVEAQGVEAKSRYTIEQWIANTAEDARDAIRTNPPEHYLAVGEDQDAIQQQIETTQELIGQTVQVADDVEEATMDLADHLITNSGLKDKDLVHYAGTPWPD